MEDLHESLAELDVEGGVDNRVDSAVDIAEPREGAVHGRRDVAVAVHVQDVSDEEGEPADDENTWGGKGERRILIAESWADSRAVRTVRFSLVEGEYISQRNMFCVCRLSALVWVLPRY